MRGKFHTFSGNTFSRVLVFALIMAIVMPVPLAGNAIAQGADDGTAHVRARLNSPERARAIEEAARMDAARAEFTRSESVAAKPAAAPVPSAVVPARDSAATLTLSKPQNTETQRPKTVSEVLFNGMAGFMGMPGLAPQRDINGNYDEGLGFHQDGTVRKAGGATGSSSAMDGRRAASYARSGLGYGPGGVGGMNGLGFGYNDPNDPFNQWRQEDTTRGGRISGSNGMGGMGYGNSRDMSNFDPARMAMDRGLNYGLGIANSAGEAALSGLMDGGRARLNFNIDWDGRINGEGDVLLPFYDSQYTTIYTQLGARSMSGMNSGDSDDGSGADRWIGNAGIGQRWFPQAQSLADSGNWMLGYNAFFDYDFTRSHQRGGVGIEAQYDWLRLASNYYFPITSWRDSKDFDGDFVKERAAEGWDLRVKGYLPFYRNVAVTGAYSQWFGDNVGMFSSDKLEKDPKVWSYGLEYTPIPLVSAFVNQRSTEQGRSDTEFGLNFTYHFQMPWEDQISHAKVAQLRTVSGSRHEFVDRENRIILEYKAKNSYRIEYVGKVGANAFKFRIQDGFGKYMAGQVVRVSAGGGVTLAEAVVPAASKSFLAQAGEFIGDLFSVSTAHAADFSQTYTSDGNGEFIIWLDNVTTTPVVVTVQAGSSTQSFSLQGAEVTAAPYTVEVSPTALTQNVAASVTFTFKQGGVALSSATPVTFTANANFTNLPGATTTDANGQVTVAALTATATGNQTITATIGGQTVNVALNVISATTYTLEATPTALTQNVAASVTFTFKQGGVALSSATLVTFTANANFTNLPGATTTDANGQVTVATLTATATGNQTITATIDSQAVNVAFIVASNVPAITTASPLPNVTANAAYSQTLAASGGVAPYTYTVTTGSLPTGLTLAANGALTGTPTAPGVSTFTVTVTDSASVTATKAFSLTVNAAPALALTFAQSLYTVTSTSGNTSVQVNLANAAGGEQINWSITSSGGTNGATLSGTSSTISSGSAAITVTGANVRRSVTVKAELSSDPSKTATTVVRFGAALASGVIALSSGSINRATANTFCSDQGGQLPSAGMDGKADSASGTYDGSGSAFGAVGSNTLSLPDGTYWTRDTATGVVNPDGYFWDVGVVGGGVAVVVALVGSNSGGAVCIP